MTELEIISSPLSFHHSLFPTEVEQEVKAYRLRVDHALSQLAVPASKADPFIWIPLARAA